MVSFQSLGLSNEVLKALVDLGFKKPSEIQAAAIPQLIYGNKDFIGLAQTGTGKTAAFGLPLLERVDPNLKHTQGLILAPTRELGQQIAEQLNLFSKYLKKLNVLPVYGGAPITQQIRALKKPQHLIIATPGRLIDLIRRKAIHLDKINFLILDEADEMLNMGFKLEIDKILTYTPKEKRTWLFSATMPPEIKRIIQIFMDDPIEVRINSKVKVNKNIDHQYSFVKSSNKTEALCRFIDIFPKMRGLVFCRTKRDTQSLADDLNNKNYRVDAIHGDLSQQKRDRVMKRFKTNQVQILVATDVAARGIDVNDISHVFHHTLPDDDAYYTHRSGRTARAGKKGISIALIAGNEKYKIQRLERQLDISFTRTLIPSAKDIVEFRIEKWCQNVLDAKPYENWNSISEKTKPLLENLTKEELVTKILSIELDKLNIDKQNINEETNKQKRSKRGVHKNKGKHIMKSKRSSKNFKKRKKKKTW